MFGLEKLLRENTFETRSLFTGAICSLWMNEWHSPSMPPRYAIVLTFALLFNPSGTEWVGWVQSRHRIDHGRIGKNLKHLSLSCNMGSALMGRGLEYPALLVEGVPWRGTTCALGLTASRWFITPLSPCTTTTTTIDRINPHIGALVRSTCGAR